MKTVLITGSTGGIGGAAARFYSGQGYNLILPVRDLSKPEAQALMLLPGANVLLYDIEKTAAVMQLLTMLKNDGISIDIVFLAAGTFKWDDSFPGETQEEQADHAKEFLLRANLLTKQNVVSALQSVYADTLRGIEVYSMSSHAAHFPVDHAFRIGKYKEEGYVHAMHEVSRYGQQLDEQGIFKFVRTLEPGLIDTPMARQEFTIERAGTIDWNSIPKPDQYIYSELSHAA